MADTNNHAVRVVDLTARRVDTLALRLEKAATARPLRRVEAPAAPRAPVFAGDTIRLPRESMAPGEGVLTLALELPLGYRWGAGDPATVTVSSSARGVVAIA
ncbi:MAG: hypothetical protein NT049_10400, partial [Planctomycetota bacterium]|nr:hypothetical protein [Planctomycetota bacterium]